jgi:hypothetical protein
MKVNNRATPVEIVESIVDSLRFELSALRDSEEMAPLNGYDAVDRIVHRENLSIFYHILEEQWLDCLHHDWSVSSFAKGTVLAPVGDRQTAIDLALGQYREEALNLELVGRAQQLLKGSIPPVVGIIRDPKNRSQYRIATSSEDLSGEILRILATEADLEPFTNLPVEAISGLTVLEMLNVWSSLVPLADDIAQRMPRDEHIKTVNQLEQFAPIQDSVAIARLLAKANQLPLPKCTAALKLLTWRDGRDSIWHRPFVPIDKKNKCLIVLPALRTPNLRRSIEYWLAEGGNDLAVRGDVFEQQIRDNLRSACMNNPLLSNAGVLTERAMPDDPTIGDIDLLVWIENTILVGESKCLLRPASSHEWFQHNERIHDAARQAKRKAEWVATHRDWFQKVSGHTLNQSALKVLSCVIVNSARSALRVIDSVAVVDDYILDRFFGVGYGTMFTTLHDEGSARKLRFYENSSEAASKLETFLHEPPHLMVYRNSIEMAFRVQPDFTRPEQTVVSYFPQVKVKLTTSQGSE